MQDAESKECMESCHGFVTRAGYNRLSAERRLADRQMREIVTAALSSILTHIYSPALLMKWYNAVGGSPCLKIYTKTKRYTPPGWNMAQTNTQKWLEKGKTGWNHRHKEVCEHWIRKRGTGEQWEEGREANRRLATDGGDRERYGGREREMEEEKKKRCLQGQREAETTWPLWNEGEGEKKRGKSEVTNPMTFSLLVLPQGNGGTAYECIRQSVAETAQLWMYPTGRQSHVCFTR